MYLGTKLVPPRNARSDIVESAHKGHFSPETIYNDLRKYYFWPQMFKFVDQRQTHAKVAGSIRNQNQDNSHLFQSSYKPLSLGNAGVLI